MIYSQVPGLGTQVLLLLLLAGVPEAYANSNNKVAEEAKPQRWLVLGVDGPSFSSDLRNAFTQALRETVSEHVPENQVLLPEPQMKLKRLAVAAKCEALIKNCVSPIGKMVGARHVIFAQMTGDLERAELSLLFLDSQNQSRSEITSVMTSLTLESETEFRHHVAVILGSKRTMPTGTLVLVGVDNKKSLRFFLDGQPVDMTKLERVAFGAHHLLVRSDTGDEFEWKGIIHPNRRTSLNVVLRPANKASDGNSGAVGSFERFPIAWSLTLAGGLASLSGAGFAWHMNHAYDDLLAQQESVSERCLAAGANCTAVTICDVANPPSECSTVARSEALMNGFLYSGGALLLGGITAFAWEYLVNDSSMHPELVVKDGGVQAHWGWGF